MATKHKPELFVVDGSNIATEGRSVPSLEQLNDAVLAFLDAHPHAKVTVVVDATFGHRIAKKEVKAFDEAVANNELVTPPAGAVGRGDAFVLAIADKAGAGVLSNDSFQEFHGDFVWLFDDGRLIGGKPVPHVGWVFVKRTPVRGPKSRQSIREAGSDATSSKQQANRRVRKKAAAPAEEPSTESNDTDATTDDVGAPSATAQGSSRSRRGRRGKKSAEQLAPDQQATIEAAKAVTVPKEHVNELMPFLEFVEHHPLGTSITAEVDSYASHGAYARIDDVLVYIPLRLMDDPAPRSARSVLAVGDAVTAVIVGYVPDRRSIDAALPHMAGDVATLEPVSEAPGKTSRPAKKTTAKKARAKKAPAKKTAAKKTTAKKAPVKKTAAKKAPAKRAAAKKATAQTSVAPTGSPGASSAEAEAPAGRTTAKKAPAKKTASKKAPAKKAPAKKAAAQRTTAKKAPAKKVTAKQTAAKKAPAKKRAPSD